MGKEKKEQEEGKEIEEERRKLTNCTSKEGGRHAPTGCTISGQFPTLSFKGKLGNNPIFSPLQK